MSPTFLKQSIFTQHRRYSLFFALKSEFLDFFYIVFYLIHYEGYLATHYLGIKRNLWYFNTLSCNVNHSYVLRRQNKNKNRNLLPTLKQPLDNVPVYLIFNAGELSSHRTEFTEETIKKILLEDQNL